MKPLYLALLLAPLSAVADVNPALLDMQDGVRRPAPESLNLAEYQAWAAPMLAPNDAVSAFTAKVFEWYQGEKDKPLPPQVYQDRERIFVSVDRPLQETIAFEAAGDITEGNTVGAEVYAEQTGTVAQALTTMLFRWGKPPVNGVWDGKTFPPGGNFQKRVDYMAPNADWGPGAFATLTMRRNGGILQDLADRYVVLLRGDDAHGYDVLMQYVKKGGTTSTEKCFAIAMIRPLPNGKVSYKISTRYQGQTYKILGSIEIGRKQIGFNVAKVRAVQVESNGLLKELQDTGTIHDRPTDIGWGQ